MLVDFNIEPSHIAESNNPAAYYLSRNLLITNFDHFNLEKLSQEVQRLPEHSNYI